MILVKIYNKYLAALLVIDSQFSKCILALNKVALKTTQDAKNINTALTVIEAYNNVTGDISRYES